MFNLFEKQQPEESIRLIGPEFIAKVDELEKKGVSKPEIVIACGHVKYAPDGRKRPDFVGFYDQILIDKFGIDPKNIDMPDRKLSYRTKVQYNGQILIGKDYTAKMNLEHGDEFKIKLTKSGILLIPLESSMDHIDTSEIMD